jgi:hypothetical protein
MPSFLVFVRSVMTKPTPFLAKYAAGKCVIAEFVRLAQQARKL